MKSGPKRALAMLQNIKKESKVVLLLCNFNIDPTLEGRFSWQGKGTMP
jgi:hypothetical protein